MRIAHTSDWHAGRVFKQVARLPELAAVLEAMGDDLEREKVELLLVSGDVFDSGAPSADAERLVFSFFRRVGRAGLRTVVIAGNHDNASRMEAWGRLAELVDVTVVERPRSRDEGGLVELATRGGERAQVAAVPFAAPRLFVSALEAAQGRTDAAGQRLPGETVARQSYAEGLAAVVANLSEGFRPDAVNLLMLHTHLTGAVFSGSERQVHLGDDWAATPQAIPSRAQYVALGHIHNPQRVEAASAPALYAGSPLQMDFGEEGEDKSFVLVDARAGQPARIERVPYRGGRRLRRLRADLETLERDAPALRESGDLLALSVPLRTADPELNARVRRLLPNAVRVEAEVEAASGAAATLRPAAGTSERELFRAYQRARRGSEPPEELMRAFDELLHGCQD
jgi:exonuclease SbcD